MSALPPATGDEQRSRLQRALGSAYELREQIGAGGFATVYAAFDTQLKREVAVKVLRAELEAPVFRERFRREAESVAQLRHPHVVPIYAVGEGEGLAYLVMPYVRGESLQQRMEHAGKLPIDEATRILRDSASALAAAHRMGIVHRDIKPDNIMLDGVEGHVLLMDFGIAKAFGGSEAGITATGMIVGTPQYMSPEQATGEKTVDHRSDIYSLGIVGFQMIAGAPPFNAPSVPALIMKQIAEPAPPLRSVRRDCPASLEGAIARCLAKEPEQRWSSADELVHALKHDGSSHLTPGIQRLAKRVSGAVATAEVPDPVRRFRVAMLVAAVALAIAIVADVAMRTAIASPVVLLVGGFALASMYGRLWTDGYSWRRVVSPASSTDGRDTDHDALTRTGSTPTPRSLELKRLGSRSPQVHRARSDRGTIIAILAQLPRSERERMPDVLTPLDSLIAEATNLAGQLTALDSAPAEPLSTLTDQVTRIQQEPASPSRDQRLALAEARVKVAREREERRERMEERLRQCFGSIEAIRVAVERIDAEGWTASESALRQALGAETQRASATAG